MENIFNNWSTLAFTYKINIFIKQGAHLDGFHDGGFPALMNINTLTAEIHRVNGIFTEPVGHGGTDYTA